MFSVTTSPPQQHDHTMADNETKLVKMNGVTPHEEDFVVFGEGTNSAQASRGFGGGTAVNFEDDIFMDAEMGLNMTTNTFTTATSSGSYTEATPDNENADSETSSPSKPGTTREPPECPLTGEPLVDPVVNPTDGVSYERSAIVSEEEKDLYYPNRALKEYIEALQETAATSSSSTDTDDDDNEQDPPKQSLSSEDLLDIFVCPITQELLRDPVIDPEGNTYERSAVINWIQQHGVSPITREKLTVQQLYDNTTLFVVLMQEIQLQEEQQRQSNDEEGDDTTHNNEEVQQWKTAVSGSTDATETTAGDSEMLMMSSSLCLEDFQPQGQLQDLEAAHEVPNLLFPELAAVPEEQRRRGTRSSSNRRSSSGRRSSSSSSRRQSQRRPPPIHYDTPDVNDLVRREQQIARSILQQMERDEQRKNRRKTCLIWAFLFVSMVCMMVGLFFVYQLAAFVFLLAILIFIAMSFCIGGMPCEFTSGTAGLSGALNAI